MGTVLEDVPRVMPAALETRTVTSASPTSLRAMATSGEPSLLRMAVEASAPQEKWISPS